MVHPQPLSNKGTAPDHGGEEHQRVGAVVTNIHWV